MRVEDPAGERVVERLVDDGAEAGHRDEIHLGRPQGLCQGHRVGAAVEVATEAAEVPPVDEHRVDVVAGRHLEAGTRAVREHERHRHAPLEHRVEDRPAS